MKSQQEQENSLRAKSKKKKKIREKRKVLTNLDPTDRSRIPNQRGIQEEAKERKKKKGNHAERKGKGWSAHRWWGRGRPRGCWR